MENMHSLLDKCLFLLPISVYALLLLLLLKRVSSE